MFPKNKVKTKYDNCAYLMIMPAFSIFALFVLVPIAIVIYYSFTDFNLYSAPNFVKFNNYIQIFSDQDFLVSIKNTAIYSVCTLFPQLAIGLSIAVLLYRKSRLVPLLRTAFYLPNVMSMMCVSMIWLWIYDPTTGILNRILEFFGFAPQLWLRDPKLALPCVIVLSIWKSCGYSMVIYLSGLTGIPSSLYEAAELDGANAWKQFTAITWPMLRSTTFFLLVTGIVNSFAVFEQVNVMTNGGPLNSTTTIVHQIYRRAFLDFRMGYGSAMSVILLLFSIVITLAIFRYGNRGQDTDVS